MKFVLEQEISKGFELITQLSAIVKQAIINRKVTEFTIKAGVTKAPLAADGTFEIDIKIHEPDHSIDNQFPPAGEVNSLGERMAS